MAAVAPLRGAVVSDNPWQVDTVGISSPTPLSGVRVCAGEEQW
jgi:hypothetical protein